MTRLSAFWLAWRDASALEEAQDIATRAVTAAQEAIEQRDHARKVTAMYQARVLALSTQLADRDRFEAAWLRAFEEREAL